jgi:hypothetical protein
MYIDDAFPIKVVLSFIVFILRHAYCQKNSKNRINMEVKGPYDLYYFKVVTEVQTVIVDVWFRSPFSLVFDVIISEE